MRDNKADRASSDDHHIYPQSRFPELKSSSENKAHIVRYFHKRYHDLVENKTPEEIGVWFATYFWGNNKNIIKNVIMELETLLNTPTRRKRRKRGK